MKNKGERQFMKKLKIQPNKIFVRKGGGKKKMQTLQSGRD